MTLIVEKSGMVTTVQDLGRPGQRGVWSEVGGLPEGGAVDRLSARVANLLVGNIEGAAVLECALVGPVLTFSESRRVALTGARVPTLPYAEAFVIEAGGQLDLTRIGSGVYTYLAVAGGVDVPLVFGSRATDVRLGFGGLAGRPLSPGDRLPLGPVPAKPTIKHDSPVAAIGAWYDTQVPIRVVGGRDGDRCKTDWLQQSYRMSSRLDRMGVRLDGAAVQCAAPADGPSAVVLPGTIQLPGDGQPIVLLADAQTLGGYPQLGHVIQADRHRIAQLRPGSEVRFQQVSVGEAHRLLHKLDRELAFLRTGLQLKGGTRGG